MTHADTVAILKSAYCSLPLKYALHCNTQYEAADATYCNWKIERFVANDCAINVTREISRTIIIII